MLKIIMASLFKCQYCKGIMGVTDKNRRFKENTCLECGSTKKEEWRLVSKAIKIIMIICPRIYSQNENFLFTYIVTMDNI